MTRQYKLGQIATVDLRDVWPHEVLDFTKWLSENENLEILSEAVGIELELVETESSVGSFNVDIFADEVGTGRKVMGMLTFFQPKASYAANPSDLLY